MKKYWCIFILLFLIGTAVTAQHNKFEGKIEYEFLQLDSAAKIPFPAEYVVYYKGNKFKTATRHKGQKDYQEIITNSSSLQYTLLYKGFEGHNYAVTNAQPNTFSTKADSIATFTDQTKVIAGYICKKVILESRRLGLMEVYYTPEIGSKLMNFDTPFFEIDGVVMEQTVTSPDGRKYKVTASRVIPEKISDEIVSTPSGFETINWEEWTKIKAKKRTEQSKE